MTNIVKVVFEQCYKSFMQGQEYVFGGKLNIISGINGAGKSQLFEAIKRYNTSVYINDKLISKNDILLYSFRNNIFLPSFGTYDFDSTKYYENVFITIFNNYKNLYRAYNNTKRSNPNDYYNILTISKNTSLEDYCISNLNYLISFKENNTNISTSKSLSKTTIAQIINCVKEKHPDDFLELSDSEIIDSIPSDIIFKYEDETVESITRVFTESARVRALKQMSCGTKGVKFNNEEWLKSAPWTEINNLFSKLNFNYRFAEDFEYEIPYLKETPKLFAFENGSINKKKIREINDLSDGEKAILNLVITTYDRKNDTSSKILLLDEYDATLNPSLIKDYYLTIQEYYLQKNIIVLLSTHSPITISLAPSIAKFYEIFRQNDTSPIIKEVDIEEYKELKVVENYYDKIKNPIERLKELEGENIDLKEKIQTATMPVVITEGKTDWKHIKLAKQKLDNHDSYLFYEYENNMGDTELLKTLKSQVNIPNANKRIFIFDNDNENIVKEVTGDVKKYKYWGNNVYSFVIPQPRLRTNEEKISIEHYYGDEILKKEFAYEDGISRRLYCGEDFNKKGINVASKKRCDNRNVCGSGMIRVLSGLGNEAVYDLDKDDDLINYAMNKEDFFEKIINNNCDDINFTPFNYILDIIKEIINLD